MRSIVTLCLAASTALAQANATSARFEVASVRVAAPRASNEGGVFGGRTGGPGTSNPERVSWRATRLDGLIRRAYELKPSQLLGPDWVLSPEGEETLYDITATLPPQTTESQLNLMLRELLAERFGLQIHREVRERPVYALTVAKGGHKLRRAKEGSLKPLTIGRPVPGGVELRGSNMSLTQIAAALETLLADSSSIVVDRSGLAGNFDFQIQFADTRSISETSPLPTLFSAVEEDLGLKLERGRAPVEVLVIDAAQRVPTEN